MVTMEAKGPNGHYLNQRAQWSPWKPKDPMVTMETKVPNGHDINQWANGHHGLMFVINLVPKKLSFFHSLFVNILPFNPGCGALAFNSCEF